MPPRTKRNANSSRRHHSAAQSYTPPSPTPDLLSFDPDPSAYGAITPAVFDPDPPPSDPELGRASTAIHDARLLPEPVDYAKHMFRPPAQVDESDIDDGGPVSPSTSPPGPSSFSNTFAVADIPSPARSGLAKLAVAEDTTSDESSLSRSIGHTRSPVLARCRSTSAASLSTYDPLVVDWGRDDLC
ncbi:hypothetical protein L226DRAFT_312651 [Lentinus tigrinus ALCF2SS1-7]|uniref:Uncharacterized protein n=1 Tax=Lentinus tigrinus ALCF2SS1-6 TaxID=1328759 RepID=A0A5C2RU87_9APHY|nr:hypothetical protein L227DRAFT_370727 [Lentinus tigrinus ALCF2SS1-6]RPD68889.1 hypothetical protein L226DRAFT_312651 [Lentinus tigrinus ALCF2SS1-7]